MRAVSALLCLCASFHIVHNAKRVVHTTKLGTAHIAKRAERGKATHARVSMHIHSCERP